MSSRKSETDFEKIEAESGTEEDESGNKRTPKAPQGSSGSWMPWSWGAQPDSSGEAYSVTSGMAKTENKGKSSGVEL